MNSEYDSHLVPSHNRSLLQSLVGRKVVRLVHYPEDPVEELLQESSYVARHVTKNQLFSKVGGPAIVTLDDGRAICISFSEELVSVTVRLADMPEFDVGGWPDPIDVANSDYSEPRFAHSLGKAITRVMVFQLVLPNTDQPHAVDTKAGTYGVWMPKVMARPREVDLALVFDDGTQLVFSTASVDAPNNFLVATELVDRDVPVREILRIDATTR